MYRIKTHVILAFFLLTTSAACGSTGDAGDLQTVTAQLNPEKPEDYNIVITVIDENGDPFQASGLTIRFSDGRVPNQLQGYCKYDTCTLWVIGADMTGDINVRAWGFEKTDEWCSKTYEGSAQIIADPNIKQDIEIEVTYTGLVCA